MTIKTKKLNAALLNVPPMLRELVLRHWAVYVDEAQQAQITLLDDEALLMDLAKVWACSDFVAQACSRQPLMLHDLCNSGDLLRQYSADEYVPILSKKLAQVSNDDALAVVLRHYRRREMVRIAWRDIAGLADLDETLADLSRLACACVDEALSCLHQWQCQEFGVPYGAESQTPQTLIVLGMGKLGAGELNFSSDIDLIFTYPEDGETRDGRVVRTNKEFFLRLGQRLISALNQQTADGFVFRVDMRLRPFGDTGPLAAAFGPTEQYYQSHGREWERYALIKAGVIAGNRAEGERLLAMLRPFIYRRYLDYGAFESLREMKLMIKRQVARKGMKGNIKLGPGGIREVEFIGQAFQLIRGGRDPDLQVRPIRQVLARLGEKNCLPVDVTDALDKAYVFLRRAENRIQALADQQTHRLPKDETPRQRLAFAMGYDIWADFSAEIQHHMSVVQRHFEHVFSAPQSEQATEQGSIYDAVWCDDCDEVEAVAVLAAQGFDRASEAQRLLLGLHKSRRYQGLSPQGKARLDRLMPRLLAAVVLAAQPTQTLARLITLLETIVRRSAYLALLVENPLALSQLVKLCAASAWIASHMARYPILFDELLDPRHLYQPLDREALTAELAMILGRAGDDEEQQMEVLRQFKQANVLKVAAADISGVYPLMTVSDHLTEIAEVVTEGVVRLAYAQLLHRHGRPHGHEAQAAVPEFIVVAYGKMGGIELGYGSDLDVVFLRSGAIDGGSTDGDKPLDNTVFFIRLAQRIIHTMTAHTPAGVLYDVDSRLRPSGAAGVLVSTIEAFAKYQRSEAWTWEHQALVRARVVAGDPVLAQQFEVVRREVLSQPRDVATLREEVVAMRQKMRNQLSKAKAGEFDLKQSPGGIADIEFIVQYSILRWAHEYPSLLTWTDNIRQLQALAAEGLMATEDAQALADAYRRYRNAAHHLTLQAQAAVMAESPFCAEQKTVKRIWRDLMETVQ